MEEILDDALSQKLIYDTIMEEFLNVLSGINPTLHQILIQAYNVDICNIVKSYYEIEWMDQIEKYQMALYDIRTNLTDIKICFGDGSHILGLKCILNKIPYFKMMFEDCGDGDEIIVELNSDMTIILIESLYLKNMMDHITILNAFKMLKLMDKVMFYDDIDKILDIFRFRCPTNTNTNDWIDDKFIKILRKYPNIKGNIIISQLITNEDNSTKPCLITLETIFKICENEIENLIKLEIIFHNIINNDFTEQNFEPNINVVILYSATIVRDYIFSIIGEYINGQQNDKCNIFMFNRWAEIFSEEQKLCAITKLGDYTLLNHANISPKIVLPFLKQKYSRKYTGDYQTVMENITENESKYSDFFLCKYQDIIDRFNWNLPEVYFIGNTEKNINFDTGNIDTIVHITSYYPKLEYANFNKIHLNVYDTENNSIKISGYNGLESKIMIGTEIIINSINTTFIVEKIKVYIDNVVTYVSSLPKHDNNAKNMSYELIVNQPFVNGTYTKWCKNKYSHAIQF